MWWRARSTNKTNQELQHSHNCKGSAVSHKIKAATVADLSPAVCGSGKSCRRATVDRSGCKGNCLGILDSP